MSARCSSAGSASAPGSCLRFWTVAPSGAKVKNKQRPESSPPHKSAIKTSQLAGGKEVCPEM